MQKYFLRIYFILLTVIFLISCSDQPPQQEIKPDFWIQNIPSNASYSFRINKKVYPDNINLSVLDKYLSKTDKTLIGKLQPEIPYGIHIFQKDPELNSFLIIGKIKNFKNLFLEKKRQYNGINIYEAQFNKKKYYGFQNHNLTYISNHSISLENSIRSLTDTQKKDLLLDQMNHILDNNSEINLIQFTSNLRPDIFNSTLLKIPLKNWDKLEGFDIIDSQKDLYTGIALDNKNDFLSVFKNLKEIDKKNFDFIPTSFTKFTQFSTHNFDHFYKNYSKLFTIGYNLSQQEKNLLNTVQSISIIKENNNYALCLNLKEAENFIKNQSLAEDFMTYSIKKVNSDFNLLKKLEKILPNFKLEYFIIKGDRLILTENLPYLKKLIIDIENHNTLAFDKSFKKIWQEIPEQEHLINLQKIQNKLIYKSYENTDGTISVSQIIEKTNTKFKKSVAQFLALELPKVPITLPQLVYNYKHKTYRIIYQNENKQLVYADMNGKVLWKKELQEKILGKINVVDLFRNGKTQYTFVTPKKWYIIDRYGRNIPGFPIKFSKITQALSIFDYDKNRKYRFGIVQGKKFQLYNNKGKKVKGFKVKTQSEIAFSPQHFRIGTKDLIEIQEKSGKLNLLDRRGRPRIKVKDLFKNLQQDWKVYKKKFINIVNDSLLVSINLKGEIKKGSLKIGQPIRFNSKFDHLVAVTDHKLLIDNHIFPIDIGNYDKPKLFRDKQRNIYIFLSNGENNKIYAYNLEGKPIKGFPVIGKKVLDIKKVNKENYLLVYDNQQNLLIYKF